MGIADEIDAIFNTTDRSRLQPFFSSKGIIPLEDEKNAQKRHTAPVNTIPEAHTRIGREAEKRRQEQERYRRIVREQQDAIKRCGNLRSDILKGIRKGESTTALLLKACECISLITGDKPFCEQIEKDIRGIYGYGLGDPYPLQQELSDTKGRLARLMQAEEKEPDADTKRRLQGAIKAHRKRIEQIEKSLHR